MTARENEGWRPHIRRLLHLDPPVDDAAAPAEPLSQEEALARYHEMVSAPTSEARFLCARHGTEAGVVKLYRRFSGNSEVVVESFLGRVWHRLDVPLDETLFGDPMAEGLSTALGLGEAIDVHLLNREWTPFFCTGCAKVYCGECWTTVEVPDPAWPEWVAQVRGTCPQGHDNILYGWPTPE